MANVSRRTCARCGGEFLVTEASCWQCGARFVADEQDASAAMIDFAAQASADRDASAAGAQKAPRRTAVTLTGEVVELPEEGVSFAAEPPPTSGAAFVPETSTGEPAAPVMRLTYCKTCGLQNEEAAVECRKCRKPLEIVAAGSIGDIKALPRAWGFDVLGVAWLALGFAAVYCGMFMVKADPKHPGTTWADYFWTGTVVCAPGVLIFLRHYFCKMLFWVMTFGSVIIWAIIAFVWLVIGLFVSDNGQVGLMWFGALSALSAVSYLTVRQNDAFDFGS